MPPDRGRASKACASCRKQKTRCYESSRPRGPCLRCERLNQRCSFIQDTVEETPASAETSIDARLERLEKIVTRLLDRLGEDTSEVGGSPQQPDSHNHPAPATANAGDLTTKIDSFAAPVIVIRDLAADTGIGPPTTSQTASIEDLVPSDIALELITIFLEHYGRWVLFDPDENPSILLERVSKSPLLLCACCLIAVRHTSQDIAANLALKLYENARSLVQSALLASPQSIEFFQAVLILCMWSTTVGQVPLSIDSWLLSGFALQHCHSSPLFSDIIDPAATPEFDKLTSQRWFLWNHICLVHLHYCVGTSRRSMLQDWHIGRCRSIITSDRATNYELRMVAEVHLYDRVYKLLAERVDIPQSLASLQAWQNDWQFVLEQPRAQFLMMGLHFSHLLLYDRSLKSKSARAQGSIVADMVTNATAIIRLAMETVDEQTKHLTDHIYHMITFSAIVICRLIDSEQQTTIANVMELDELISSLVQWLHSVGLPCHAAHTFGTIISQVQHKSRPEVASIPAVGETNDILNEDFTRYYFPEFLGVEATPNGGWDLSNFAFFPQDYSLPDGIN
ncbi:hypothetical protein BDW74DRAFT_172449 [Aspergillus multicolor]|uniref:Zn(II)2Cys6 transcription factor n=1 Tax=Aspergillus multicolor TaxID=41759 RepID=UPI003CCD4D39